MQANAQKNCQQLKSIIEKQLSHEKKESFACSPLAEK